MRRGRRPRILRAPPAAPPHGRGARRPRAAPAPAPPGSPRRLPASGRTRPDSPTRPVGKRTPVATRLQQLEQLTDQIGKAKALDPAADALAGAVNAALEP